MWPLLIGYLITLWAIAFLIWSLWRWRRLGNEVRRPAQGSAEKL